MAVLLKGFIFTACVFSAFAVGLSLVSMFTSQWVVAELKFQQNIGIQRTSTLKYGLFSGVFWIPFDGSSTAYLVTMTCSYLDNICAVLCKFSDRERDEELQKLKKNRLVSFDPGCPQVPRTQKIPQFFINQMRNIIDDQMPRSFLNAGLYLSTVVFLWFSIALGAAAAAVSFWNLIGSPKERIFSMSAAFHYNSSALLAAILAVTFWGAQFAWKVTKDVGLLLTITNIMEHFHLPLLGFSYWINFGSMLLYFFSIFTLFVRNQLIKSTEIGYSAPPIN